MIYYGFEDTLIEWHDEILQAKIINETDELSLQGLFWKAEPLPQPFRLQFKVNGKAPFLDNYFTGTNFPLYSKKLIDLLAEAGVKFECFPATLIHRRTGAVLPNEYFVFNLLEMHTGMEENLKAPYEPGAARAPMFRIKEAIDIVLISEELKDRLEKEDITGCEILPVKQIPFGHLAWYRKKKLRDAAENSTSADSSTDQVSQPSGGVTVAPSPDPIPSPQTQKQEFKMPQEKELSEDEWNEIKRLAGEIFTVIPAPENPDDPQQVIKAIDDYLVKLKNKESREFSEEEATEMAFRLGPRWGEEMRKALGWDWIVYLGEHGFKGYAIAAPDRSVICLPMNTIYQKLLQEDPDITMLLIFNMIKGGEASAKPGRYLAIG